MKNIWFLLLFLTNYCFGQEVKVEIRATSQNVWDVLDQFEFGEDGYFLKHTKIPDRIYAGGWKYYISDTQESFNLAKNPKKMVIDLTKMNYKKGEYQAVANFSRHDFPTSFCFSRDAKYAVAVSASGRDLYLNSMDLSSRKQVWKNVKIAMDGSVAPLSVAASTDAAQIAIWSSDGLWIVDTSSKTSKKVCSKENLDKMAHDAPRMLWSQNSSHLVITRKLKKETTGGAPLLAVYDYDKQEVLYSIYDYVPTADEEPYALNKDIYDTYSICVDSEGNVKEKLEAQGSVDSQSIGVLISPFSCAIYDMDGNNYSVLSNTANRSISDMLLINEKPLEQNLDPIPIVADRLSMKGQTALILRLSALSNEMNNVSMVQKAVETLGPFSAELISKLLLTSSDDDDAQLVNILLATELTKNTLETDISELVTRGMEVNKRDHRFIQKYASPGVLSESDIDQAIKKIAPLTFDFYYRSADENLREGNKVVNSVPRTAALYYEAALTKEPNNQYALLGLAKAYSNMKIFDKSIEAYNKCLALDPDMPSALYGIIQLNFQAVQQNSELLDETRVQLMDESVDRFLAVAGEESEKKKAYARGAKDMLRIQLYDADLFVEYYEIDVTADKEKNIEPIAAILPKLEAKNYHQLAVNLYNQGGLDIVDLLDEEKVDTSYAKQAAQYLEKAIAGGFVTPRAYYEWARMYMDYMDDSEKGLSIIVKAKKVYPSDGQFKKLEGSVYYVNGQRAYENGDLRKAISDLEKYESIVKRNNMNFKAIYTLSYACYESKQYSKAVKYLEYIKANRDNNHLYAYHPNFEEVLAYSQNPSGTAPELIHNADKIISLEDRYDEGSALLDEGKIDEAISVMKEVSDEFLSINYHYGIAITHSGLGVAYCQKQEFKTAIPYLEKCIEVGAQSSSCYNNLALAKHYDHQFGVFDVLNAGKKKFPNAEDLKKTYKMLMDD
ncbi:MAG: tetratricopeptide repeat protein [Reichenbachiella sp.]